MDKFENFADLSRHKKEDEDYSVTVRAVPRSKVAIVAPHGGIEVNTAEMAREIAAYDCNLYLFEGLEGGGSFEDLHLTSIHFDEPRCLDLVAKTDATVTIHGCRGEEPVIYLSALDKKLESTLSAAFNKAGIKALTSGHTYTIGALPGNICNKNQKKQGVQLEFSRGIRDNPVLRDQCIQIVRDAVTVPSMIKESSHLDKFKDFSDLASHKKEGEHYSIVAREVPGSTVAIVAPHGHKIDWHTEKMAQAIAADDFNLYMFNSTQPEGNSLSDLHITSTHFDEPRCLDLVAKSDVTLTIHGNALPDTVVCLSGMDKKLESKLAAAFNAAGVNAVIKGHLYQSGKLPENICNRNRQKQGVQLEFSRGIRDNPVLRDKCVRIVRESLRN